VHVVVFWQNEVIQVIPIALVGIARIAAVSAVFDVVVVVVIILVAGCFVKADARHGGRLSVTAVDEPQGIATMLHIFFCFLVVELCGVVVRVCLLVWVCQIFLFVRPGRQIKAILGENKRIRCPKKRSRYKRKKKENQGIR
jgi:hypothetical protein